MAGFRLCLLGGFEVQWGSRPLALHISKKSAGLLACLAVRPGQPWSRDRLAGLLWGDAAPDQARHSLRQALLATRRALAELASPGLITREGEMLALDPAAIEVDVAAFEHLVSEGELEQAAALYRGDLLDGLHINEVGFEEWVLAERERLRETAVEALARLLNDQRRRGPIEPAIQTALRLLRLDRTQEVVHRTLIQLYACQGRRAEALRQYRACVGALRGELGVEPEPETVRLYREIVRPRTTAGVVVGA